MIIKAKSFPVETHQSRAVHSTERLKPTKMKQIFSRTITRSFHSTTTSSFLGRLNRSLTATKPKKHVVVTLNTPIGITEKPQDDDNNGDQRSVVTKFKDFLDPVKNKQRQLELEKEISKSGMYDVYTFKQTKGKLFQSPPSYWKSEHSLYFPNLFGEDLTSFKPRGLTPTLLDKVTILRVYTSQMGENSSKSFLKYIEDGSDETTGDYLSITGYDTFKERFPNSQIVDVNITENELKAIFIKLSKSSIRNTIHRSRFDKYFIVPRKTLSLDLREKIHLDNTYGGYIYVLDHFGKIRWAGCGEASVNERNLLYRTVRGLEREFRALKGV